MRFAEYRVRSRRPHRSTRSGEPRSRRTLRAFSGRQLPAGGTLSQAIEAALGVLLPLVIGWTARQRLEGLAASVPLAVIGFGGFVLAGFGG